MKETKKRFFLSFKKNIDFIIVLGVCSVFTVLTFFRLGRNAENGIYDMLLKIKPEVTERSEVLLLNIDDFSIEEVGAWPWPRDILANVLIRLKEAGGKTAVFDIEYLSPGRSGVNGEYVEYDLPKQYESLSEEVSEYISEFSNAVASKNIPLTEVRSAGNDMSSYLQSKIDHLSQSVKQRAFVDNDAYMGNAVRFFGNTFLTINASNINISTEAEPAKEFAYNRFLFNTVEDTDGLFQKETRAARKAAGEEYGIAPTIIPILQHAKGAGFPNVVIDEDGVRRRISLFYEYNGKYISQLVFAPILELLQPEKIIRKGSRLILKNAKNPRNLQNKKDLVIPLDKNGNLLINWLKKPFSHSEIPENGSFKNLPVYALIYADTIEKNLIHLLDAVYALHIKTENGYLSYNDAVLRLQKEYADLESQKEALLNGTETGYEHYFKARKTFFEHFGTFLNSGFEHEIHEVFAAVKETNADYAAADAYVAKLFADTKTEYQTYTEHLEYIGSFCKDSFALIGYSGVGTSDLGVNPFWNAYPNVGTHANIYNTIMNEAFIRPVPKPVSVIAAFILLCLAAAVLRKIEKGYAKILFALSALLFISAAGALLFVFASIYLQLFIPVMSAAVSFLIILLLNFILTEKEKSFLRKAFGVYLSDDVVNEIVADPEKLSLGGKKKRITALFTDIKSFSTLSEKVSPEDLVSVLNIYLTKMSDIILQQSGTIDKYIGDAIVSFFGAPADLPDHAYRACLAAVRMKEAETKLNEQLYSAGNIPMPILTRIGINTGDMVVGNMGTEKKMNYTIMGNDVNLAARLEGVNKKYGTWILASEAAWKETNGAFLGRRLDRVRVVGIDTPVQLYNVMSVKEEAAPQMIELVEIFEEAISLYRQWRFKDALASFEKCLSVVPEDEPSKMYAERMKALIAEGVSAASYDDIVNMTSK